MTLEIYELAVGQRVLVFDEDYDQWVIAYYCKDGDSLQFEELLAGANRVVSARCWLPLPANPPNNAVAADRTDSTDNTTSAGGG